MRSGALHSLGIYRKSLALCKLSEALASYFSYDKGVLLMSFRDDIIQALLTDAGLIVRKVEQAALSNSYTVRMRSLAFINIMIRNMWAYCNGLEKDGVGEKEYLNVLRREIKSFRGSFVQWRKSLLPKKG